MIATLKESKRGMRRGYKMVSCKQKAPYMFEGYKNCYIEIPESATSLPEGFFDWKYIVSNPSSIIQTYWQNCNILNKPGHMYRYWTF